MSTPAPIPLPMRILVKGASNVHVMSQWSSPREDFTFPRALEQALCEQGQPALVHNNAVSSQPATHVLRTWEQEILAWSPDVIILSYGTYETIHYLLPRWLERHANSLKRRPGLVRESYRRFLLRPVWKLLAQGQSALDRRFDSIVRRNRPRQVAAHLTRLVERATSVNHPLILIFEVFPPGSRARSWFPGIAERTEVMNRTLEQLVDRIADPDVRLFRLTDIAARVTPEGEDPVPDGVHFSAQVHRAVGRALADEVLAWAAKQPHLQGGQ